MQRRSFIGAILAGCAAPAIVKAGVLMPVRKVLVPASWPMEIGRFENFRFITSQLISPEAAQRLSKSNVIERGPLSKAQLRKIMDVMRRNEVKPRDDGNYLVLADARWETYIR